MLCAQVFGNEAVVALAGAWGNFELNTMMPVLAYNLLQAIELLASASRIFAVRCVRGLEADVLRCQTNVERSLAMGTALVPAIGYDKAVQIVKTTAESGRTVREVAREMSGLDQARLSRLLDPARQTAPECRGGRPGSDPGRPPV